VIVVGNVGYLQANIPLIPDAKPNDGLLDLLVASPRGMSDWIKITTRVMTRQRRTDDQLDRLTGRRVTITVEESDQYQLDGDTVGECSSMTAEVQPGALNLRVPAAARRNMLPTAAEAAAADGEEPPGEVT
jgi:diacylglycerol kinase (ATP)